jgi:hypothetical protein
VFSPLFLQNARPVGDLARLVFIDSSTIASREIEARRARGRHPEPFVIAYRDEQSMRDVIAVPSIIASKTQLRTN